MPIPKPKSGEKQSQFMLRCVPILSKEYGKEQAIAICYSSFKNGKMSLNDSYNDSLSGCYGYESYSIFFNKIGF